jgi:hypothetical protein
MKEQNQYDFKGKSFCFTGQLAELKRTQAEREVRSRQGLTQKVINADLDYLVIGSIPSIGWKHGDYGNKIEKAVQLIEDGICDLRLVPEEDFMLALENTPASESGELDKKILTIRYSAMVKNGEFDIDALEAHLAFIQRNLEFHATVRIEEPYIYQNLYNKYEGKDLADLLLIKSRMVKILSLEYKSQTLVTDITKGFEKINGLDGELTFSEKQEGTASFVSLLKEIPQSIDLRNQLKNI